MIRSCAICLAFVLATASALAQPAPFDMSPERGEDTLPAPETSPPSTPGSQEPLVMPEKEGSGEAAPQGAQAGKNSSVPAANAATPVAHRYVVPFQKFVLEGEQDRRSWTIHLTSNEAASLATFHFAYQNAVVVAPEASRITVAINGKEIVNEAPHSSDAFTEISTKVPAALLKPGDNEISFSAVERHRTDCTISSTYELWTAVDPSRTYLAFADSKAAGMASLGDIAAIGTDPRGNTAFNIVVPALDNPATVAPVIRLSEGLALMANMPNQSVSVTKTTEGNVGPGRMTVVVGTAAEVATILGSVPSGVDVSPAAIFVDNASTGSRTLVVSGPTWPALETAIQGIVKSVDRPLDVNRISLATRNWSSQDAPLFMEAGRKSLSELGERTEEFSGRRFRTSFTFGIPSDFYANDYGEAKLLLDAAYSSAVLPGSHIDIYVNGNIASTMPITRSGGGILRKFPISVTMRHVRPGANTLTLEAILHTKSDALCAPGATSLNKPRFALFDTSEFVVPAFARIGRRPDLGALGGTGSPYNRSTSPVPLLISRPNASTISAAANLLAHMSVATGRPIPVDTTVSPATVANQDAIFVDDIANVPVQILEPVGLASDTATTWGEDVNQPVKSDASETERAYQQWRRELSAERWHGGMGTLLSWLSRNFNLSRDSLQLAPSHASAYTPAPAASLVIAQGLAPGDGKNTWTLVTSPSPAKLKTGMQELSHIDHWAELSGRIVTVNGSEGQVHSLPVASFSFFQTRPLSLWNYRLIAANWLSANVLSYVCALFALCLILGVVTSAFLAMLGRRS